MANESWVLRVVEGGPEFAVDDRLIIGRDAEQCTAVLNDRLASRRHATLWVEDGRLLVRDENSGNGVVVDGLRIPVAEPFPLQAGQTLLLGGTELVVEARSAAEPDEMPETELLDALPALLDEAPAVEIDRLPTDPPAAPDVSAVPSAPSIPSATIDTENRQDPAVAADGPAAEAPEPTPASGTGATSPTACPQCHTPRGANDFCTNCGARFDDEPGPAPDEAPPVAAGPAPRTPRPLSPPPPPRAPSAATEPAPAGRPVQGTAPAPASHQAAAAPLSGAEPSGAMDRRQGPLDAEVVAAGGAGTSASGPAAKKGRSGCFWIGVVVGCLGLLLFCGAVAVAIGLWAYLNDNSTPNL